MQTVTKKQFKTDNQDNHLNPANHGYLCRKF